MTPTEIDGARVLMINCITNDHLSTCFTRHFVDGSPMETPFALAVCLYDGEDGYYLFYLNKDWETMNDTFHESIDLAVEQAESEFVGTKHTWQNVSI